jgi:REP element-mobilizing transposase RayT
MLIKNIHAILTIEFLNQSEQAVVILLPGRQNHVHYMIRPAQPEDMPRLMHWLNWHTAMLLNRQLRRRGHFWERRYHAAAVPDRDFRHALRALRYIHAKSPGRRHVPRLRLCLQQLPHVPTLHCERRVV